MSARLLAFAVALLLVAPVQAQDADALLAEARRAFLNEDYRQAERLLQRATERDPELADAYYLLAQLYYETPLQDNRKTEDALDRALELEPNNLEFLVAQLEFMRRETRTYVQELLRDQERRRLARRILEVDEDNAFAHEELGGTYIRDYWRYRNAVTLPFLTERSADYRRTEVPGGDENAVAEEGGSGGGGEQATPQPAAEPSTVQPGEVPDPGAVFAEDPFDLALMQQQGVGVQDLSGRADYAYERAIHHLDAALEADPRRRSVYDQLLRIYALRGEEGEALDALREMFTHFPKDPQTWLYLGYTNHRVGALDASSKAFAEAFERMPAEQQAVFDDISYFLIEDDEQEAYAQDPVAFTSRFWTSKDPRFLTPYNERKLEHYARLVYADLLYGQGRLEQPGWETERGRILVRYGVPDRDVTLMASGPGMDEELEMPGDRQFETFSPALMRDQVEESNTFQIWDYGDFRFVFEDPLRNGEYRLYSPPASDISYGVNARPWQNDYVLRARETFRTVPDRYTYEAPGRQVDLPFLTSAFKGEDGEADLYVHYGIPVAEEAGEGEVIEVTAHLGTFLVSPERDLLVERRRTLYGLRTDQVVPFDEARLWVDTQAMEAPPGEHEVAVEFETAGSATVAVQRRTVEVPDFGRDGFVLSDLLLAYSVLDVYPDEPPAAGDLVRGDLAIRPAPWSVFSHQAPVYLYFESYGHTLGEDGQTRFSVEAQLAPKEDGGRLRRWTRRIFGAADPGVSVSFEGTGTQPDEAQYLILDAADLEPGLYTLTLKVTDLVSGDTQRRQRDLFLE